MPTLLAATLVVVAAGINAAEVARLAAAASIVRAVQPSVPHGVWSRARCVVVIPDSKTESSKGTSEEGRGVMSCRAGDGWSAPVFVQLAGVRSRVGRADLVLLVMNESGVQKLLQQKVSLGTDASMAAGPVDPDASGDANAATEVLGYRRAHGSFSGADVSGAVVRADDDADHDVYGVSATPRTILASRALSAPTQATPLLVALRVGGPSATAASAAGTTTPATAGESKPAAPAPPGASGASPTGETDVRAGVVALQQSIDRLIAEANAGESATGAPAAPGTIPVSRERLVQLRRQVDALLATIDRRQ